MKTRLLPMALVVLMLLGMLSGCGKTDSQSGSEDAGQTSAAVDLKPGELFYSGKSSAEGIEGISVSFVLSEDKSTLHDFSIFIQNFQGEVADGNTTMSIDASNMMTTITNEIAVDYYGTNNGISVGDHTIESLSFSDDGTAEMVFTYCYKDYGANSYEIPVSGIRFTLTSTGEAA